MRCSACGEQNSEKDRFCGSCGSALALSCAHCGAAIPVDDQFCGECGTLRDSGGRTAVIAEISKTDLFPLYGVTLGKTTVEQLAQLGERTTSIDKTTGLAYQSYVIREVDFWYNKAGVASDMYIAKGISSIPEQWRALGFDWDIPYNQWLALLRRLGYSITVEQSPRVVTYDGHDSFSARIVATKRAKPLIKLDFNYNNGSKTDSKGTLYSISVKAP
jgi:hypothetical protein